MPEQLEFSFALRPKPEPSKYDRFEKWLQEPAPLVHVFGKNRCLVMVTTFRSYDRDLWLERDFVESHLLEASYKPTHTLTGNFLCKRKTAAGEDTAVVYQPFNRKWRSE